MKTKVCHPVEINHTIAHYLLDLDVVAIGERDIHGTYIFDVAHSERSKDLRNAVMFARQQLLQEATKNGHNILLMERFVSPLTIARKLN